MEEKIKKAYVKKQGRVWIFSAIEPGTYMTTDRFITSLSNKKIRFHYMNRYVDEKNKI